MLLKKYYLIMEKSLNIRTQIGILMTFDYVRYFKYEKKIQ
jgi:hypothetical protein